MRSSTSSMKSMCVHHRERRATDGRCRWVENVGLPFFFFFFLFFPFFSFFSLFFGVSTAAGRVGEGLGVGGWVGGGGGWPIGNA